MADHVGTAMAAHARRRGGLRLSAGLLRAHSGWDFTPLTGITATYGKGWGKGEAEHVSGASLLHRWGSAGALAGTASRRLPSLPL